MIRSFLQKTLQEVACGANQLETPLCIKQNSYSWMSRTEQQLWSALVLHYSVMNLLKWQQRAQDISKATFVNRGHTNGRGFNTQKNGVSAIPQWCSFKQQAAYKVLTCTLVFWQESYGLHNSCHLLELFVKVLQRKKKSNDWIKPIINYSNNRAFTLTIHTWNCGMVISKDLWQICPEGSAIFSDRVTYGELRDRHVSELTAIPSFHFISTTYNNRTQFQPRK